MQQDAEEQRYHYADGDGLVHKAALIPVSEIAEEGRQQEEAPVDLHVYAESASNFEGTAHYLEFTPRAGRRCDPKPLCLLESRGGGTHPGLPSGYDRARPCRRREDSAKRRSDRRGYRDHGPLPPRRRDAPAPARHPGGDVRHRRLRGQRPLTTHGGARRRDGQGGAQLEVRLPVPARHLRDLTLTPLRYDARSASPRRRQLRRLLLPGSHGGALPRRVARQIRAEERLVWGVERG